MPGEQPLISLVIPMYNVARYLPALLESFDQQPGDNSDVEIVFVDDGSPDNSSEIIERWLASTTYEAKLVKQANAGPAEARNTGMTHAHGKWISFPDSDDVLGDGYLGHVRTFLISDAAQKVDLVSANLLMLDDATGEVTNRHPLRGKFRDGHQIVDLIDNPSFIHLQAASAFYRLQTFRDADLHWNPAVKPNFEDAQLTAYYLATFDRPQIAVLPEARYLYRQRSDGSSLVQGSWGKRERYETLLELGYLPPLRDIAAANGGQAPRWVQTLIVYDLMWYFRNDHRPNTPTAWLSQELSDRFWSLLREILSYVDTDVIDSYSIVPIHDEIKAALVMAGKDERTRPTYVSVDIRDQARDLVRVWFYYVGEPPTERWTSNDTAVEPEYGKVRSVRFLGRTAMYQRIAWVPADGTLALELDGAPVKLSLGGPRGKKVESAAPGDLTERVGTNPNPSGTVPAKLARKPFWVKGAPLAQQVQGLRERVEPAAKERSKRLGAAALKQLARAPWLRKRFEDAWLLIDRDNQAQDNAERFYDYLQKSQPQVNAWFVLNRTSPDWNRLKAKGFKLIPHRSPLHAAAVQSCSQIVSSQVDHYVVAPVPPQRFPYTWQYTFLQHGVTKDDLSTWINPKPIDLMLTVTPDEHASIVDDYTPYRYTDREIKMTGFPRHDRLLELGNALKPEQRRVVLVTPTWRRELLGETTGRGNVRDLRADFWHSEYAQQWRAFLESEQLHKVAEERDWQVIFLPHPNMTDYLDDSPLGDHIHVRRFRDIDVQQLIAEAGVLVTDYSSMAFESAFLQRGVVYFQFDREEFFSGAHAYRKGTWSYEESGFGPVTEQLDDVIREVTALMNREGTPDELYAKRMADTFPLRDGLSSQRTYEAIRAMEPKRR